VVGRLHFVNAGKYTSVAYYVMGYVRAVLNGDVAADVAGNNRAVSYAGRNAKVMVLQQFVPQGAKADKAVKIGIPYQPRFKGIDDKKAVPVGAVIPVFG